MTRHSWGPKQRPTELWTEAACTRCGVVRVTRHDAGASAIPWVEFYDADGLLIDAGGRTPVCEAVAAGVSV